MTAKARARQGATDCLMLQITLASPNAVQVLAGAKSNASGLAVLSDIKLRERPGNYTLLVTSTNDKDVPPAKVCLEIVQPASPLPAYAIAAQCQKASHGTGSFVRFALL